MALMVSPIPKREHVATADHHVVMNDISWEGYETLLALRGEVASPRMAYLDGVVEIMSLSWDHERIASRIGELLELFVFERGIECNPYGSWTLKRAKAAGAESDRCYQFGSDQTQRMPDLAIEVVWTHGGLDKLEIYRRLGVKEVWFWDDGVIAVYVLGPAGYTAQARSLLVADLDLVLVCELIEDPSSLNAKRRLRDAIQPR
jgi:Uma2 family endonuclease